MYLRDKKLAIITHGMASEKSWDNVIAWVKSVCTWEKSQFAGSLTLSSGSKAGELKIDEEKIKEFVNKLLAWVAEVEEVAGFENYEHASSCS